MLTPRSIALSAGVTAMLVAGCAAADSGAGTPESTLATVGGAPVTTDDVMALLSPSGELPVRIAAGAVDTAGADPLRQALRTAIDDELMAKEADRQGVQGASRAQRISRLLEQQVPSAPEDLDETDLQAWYQDHRYLFDHVETADVGYVVLDSSARLDDVIAGMRDVQDDPEVLAQAHSAVRGGQIAVTADAEDVPLMIERIVHAAMHQGVIAYDQDPATGHWWVVEVRALTFEPSVWDEQLATKAEAAMTWSLEQERISSLTSSLEARWPVVVHEDNVERFNVSLRGD